MEEGGRGQATPPTEIEQWIDVVDIGGGLRCVAARPVIKPFHANSHVSSTRFVTVEGEHAETLFVGTGIAARLQLATEFDWCQPYTGQERENG